MILIVDSGSTKTDWIALDKNGVEFVVGPYTRYENQPGSQATMFISDPCGNHLEFKSFKDESVIFDSAW